MAWGKAWGEGKEVSFLRITATVIVMDHSIGTLGTSISRMLFGKCLTSFYWYDKHFHFQYVFREVPNVMALIYLQIPFQALQKVSGST